jgi:AraC-like DNA-binding protein
MDVNKVRVDYANLNKLGLKLQLGSFSSEVISWGFIDHTRWWRNYMHVHTYYEVCYAYSGEGTFEMLGTVYDVKAGDVFVAKPSEEHEIISSKTDPLGIYFWSYTLVPPGMSPDNPRQTITIDTPARAAPREKSPKTKPLPAGASGLDRLLHAFVESRRWVSARVPGMQHTIDLLIEEATRAEPGYTNLIEGLASKLFIDTARAVVDEKIDADEDRPRADRPEKLTVSQAMRYMRDNYGRALSIKDVAAQVCMSERHFTRVFKAQTGKSPLDYLTEIRMENACQRLLDKTMAIKDIAAAVGYPDVRYFTTVFRRHMAITPAAFRETNGTTWKDKRHIGNRE